MQDRDAVLFEALPAHASVCMQGLLDQARLSANARHEPVFYLIRPLPRSAPHLQAWPSSLGACIAALQTATARRKSSQTKWMYGCKDERGVSVRAMVRKTARASRARPAEPSALMRAFNKAVSTLKPLLLMSCIMYLDVRLCS